MTGAWFDVYESKRESYLLAIKAGDIIFNLSKSFMDGQSRGQAMNKIRNHGYKGGLLLMISYIKMNSKK